MIVFVCGLIGAGKTTYCRNYFEYYTDLDEIASHRKEDQIALTLKLHNEGKTVAHITCMPSPTERTALMPEKYIWIDTSLGQSMFNIYKRERPGEIERIHELMQANRRLLWKKKAFPFYWTIVKFPFKEIKKDDGNKSIIASSGETN